MYHKRATKLSIRETEVKRERWDEEEGAWIEVAEVTDKCNDITT